MGKNALFQNGFFTASDTLKERQSVLHALIHLHINEISGRKSMLRDEHGLLITGKLRNDVGRFALESCHEFGSHAVILKWHSRSRKYCLVNVPDNLSLLASGIRGCSAAEMREEPKA